MRFYKQNLDDQITLNLSCWSTSSHAGRGDFIYAHEDDGCYCLDENYTNLGMYV